MDLAPPTFELPERYRIEKIVSHRWQTPNAWTLKSYEADGGYQGLKKAVTVPPAELIDLVKKSNLRGRGGAGFPTGLKWSFIPKDNPKPRYLCINADESEPGTFKDRYICDLDPHLLIEGTAIAAYAIGAHTAYIYIRGEFKRPAERVEAALKEAYAAGLIGKRLGGSDYPLEITLHRGAGAYICGEESALLESLEGKRGWPRIKPPFPAVVGLFGAPTIINNVETVANLPAIVLRGAEWFAKLGTEKSGGTRLICVSGHVQKPGVFEIHMQTTVRQLVDDICGGPLPGRKIKAVIPGGLFRAGPRHRRAGRGLRIRSPQERRHDGGLGGRDRHGRFGLHGAVAVAGGQVLLRGVVRAVHALPRGDALARIPALQDRGGPRPAARSRDAARRRQGHLPLSSHGARQHHLRAGRRGGAAGPLLPQALPARVREARQGRQVPVPASMGRNDGASAALAAQRRGSRSSGVVVSASVRSSFGLRA
jgi:hypothetical protein